MKKVLFLGQIFEVEILMDIHVLSSLESQNHIFSVWSVCVSVCMRVFVCACACVCVISTIQKQDTTESSNLVFVS